MNICVERFKAFQLCLCWIATRIATWIGLFWQCCHHRSEDDDCICYFNSSVYWLRDGALISAVCCIDIHPLAAWPACRPSIMASWAHLPPANGRTIKKDKPGSQRTIEFKLGYKSSINSETGRSKLIVTAKTRKCIRQRATYK